MISSNLELLQTLTKSENRLILLMTFICVSDGIILISKYNFIKIWHNKLYYHLIRFILYDKNIYTNNNYSWNIEIMAILLKNGCFHGNNGSLATKKCVMNVCLDSPEGTLYISYRVDTSAWRNLSIKLTLLYTTYKTCNWPKMAANTG